MSARSGRTLISASTSSKEGQEASQYTIGALEKTDLDPCPFKQFRTWFAEATAAGVYQPETVNLATAELPSGKVSARMVYMKELDERGFIVYSNWDTSRKASDVQSNPHAALTFWWREMERQVRIEGAVERLSSEESQIYFDTRIRGSRLGAWASKQSTVLHNRTELESQVAEIESKFQHVDKLPVPDFWGGLRVLPSAIEFWQGRESRLHDRFRYVRESTDNSTWSILRLSP